MTQHAIHFSASDRDTRTCRWTNAKGAQTVDATTNCVRPVPWFAPWTALLTKVPDLLSVTSLSGPATLLYELPAIDLTGYSAKKQTAYNKLRDASSVSLTFDPITKLPARADFLQVSDDGSAQIEVSVTYSDYRLDGGLLLPHRIKRSMQRTPELDVTVTSYTIN